MKYLRPIEMGERVRVYRNLHKGAYSVLGRVPDVSGWRVISHTEEARLINAKFIVREAGRQRVLSERVKNVHAFVEGDWSDVDITNGYTASYNPYEAASFVTESGLPLHSAHSVVIGSGPIIFLEGVVDPVSI